jgi:hypothetical protein
MSYDLETLKQHRDALLLTEVAAWLHMFGKYHEDFLRGHHELDIQIPPDLSSGYPELFRLLTEPWPGPIWAQLPVPELNAASLSIFDLIKDHRNPNASSGLARLMWDAHGRGSGIEKGVLERFAPGQQTTIYPATALGRELEAVDLNELQARRNQLYAILERWLQGLRSANAAIDWATWRHDLIRRLEADFRTSVAETRRPMNDVTLFDQTAASVAMFKAALAQNLLSGWKDPVQRAVADKYKWRILRVGIDGLAFWGQAARLSDLLARKTLLTPALDAARTLLEETYPLGMEVYRDEDGSLFIMPDIADLLEITVDDGCLRDHLDKITAKALDQEASFTLELSQPTRNMLILGQLATAMLPDPTPSPQWLQTVWEGSRSNDICPVCGLRPQGPSKKAADRKVCNICERRRADRSKQWTADLKSTIWTDEVADVNGRLALVVGSFGQDAWLRGSAFSSVLMFDPATQHLTDPGRNNKQYDFDYNLLLQDLQQAVRRNQFTGNTLLDNLVLANARGGGFPQFYDIQVIDSDLDGLGPHPKAELLALAMLRQNPSFARIRRVWETTRAFWQTALNERGPDGSPLLPQPAPRLEIIPQNRHALDLGLFHTYELVINGIHISVVWDSDGTRFITCDNLAYLAKPEQLGRSVEQVLNEAKDRRRPITIEEPVGYGGKNKVWGTIVVETVHPLPDVYTPAIPILAEPRTFMALVPANRALDVVQAIKAKYEREMGKVRNRLPLTVGVVYAGRRTPLAALLDAGRRMLRRPAQVVQAEVKGVTPPDVLDTNWPTAVDVTLRLGEREIPIRVPTVMGDGTTPDVWYPYWQVAGKPTDRNRCFVGPDGEHWVHVCDLRPGDAVAFTPSTFDFEYLGTSGRRFEVAYGADGRRRGENCRQRPYLLEEVNDIERAWREISRRSTSQIRMVEALIETKRSAWEQPAGTLDVFPTFKQFVVDVLREAEVYSPALEQAALTSLLADALEIHLTIHKEKPQQEEA